MIWLWMSFGDSFHRWIRLGNRIRPYIQKDAWGSSYIWRDLGFVHIIHTPYYYY